MSQEQVPPEFVAYDAAVRWFAGKVYGDGPHLVHLQETVDILRSVGALPTLLAAGWLHDAIEDCGKTIEEIEREIGPRGAMLVWCVTGVGKNRKERQARILERCLAYGCDAVTLKCADRLANVEHAIRTHNTDKFTMYVREHDTFESALGWTGNRALWTRLNQAMCFTF